MHHEASLLTDTNFWYGVAVAAFVLLFLKYARKGFVGAIDAQIDKIKSELDEAKRLRAEAEATLVDYRARQDKAMQDAEKIVADAKSLAARLRKDSEIELEETLRRHEQMAVDRIAAVQHAVEADVRAYMINEALVEARGKLAKDAGSDAALKLIDQAISDIPKLSNGKVA
jgi:F-type H+-transporting ATPase subunit b